MKFAYEYDLHCIVKRPQIYKSDEKTYTKIHVQTSLQ